MLSSYPCLPYVYHIVVSLSSILLNVAPFVYNPGMSVPFLANGLTVKREHFAHLVVELDNQTEAYKQAYDVSGFTEPHGIEVEASRLALIPEVALRIEQLRSKQAIRHEITLDDITSRLIREADREGKYSQHGARVQATMGLAKVTGYLIERTESRNLSFNVDADKLLEAFTLEELKTMLREATRTIPEATGSTESHGEEAGG